MIEMGEGTKPDDPDFAGFKADWYAQKDEEGSELLVYFYVDRSMSQKVKEVLRRGRPTYPPYSYQIDLKTSEFDRFRISFPREILNDLEADVRAVKIAYETLGSLGD